MSNIAPLESLLEAMLKKAQPAVRARLLELIREDRFFSPLTPRALEKEAEMLLRLLQGDTTVENQGT